MIKLLTSYLDIAGYGLYSKIYNFLSIFAVIADLGLYTITVRELSNNQDDPKMVEKISSNVLTLRTFSGLLILLLSLSIGYFLDGYNSREWLIGIGIASIFTLLGLINSSLMSYLQSILKTEFSIIANTLGKMLTLGMIILFASLVWWTTHTERFTLVMIAGLAGNLLMTILTWWYANRWHRVRFWWDSEYIRYILRISLPYGLALFLNVIFFKVDTILLSIMEPRSIADSVIALYALPMKIVEVGMMYGTVFLNSLLPVLTDTFKKERENKEMTLVNPTARSWLDMNEVTSRRSLGHEDPSFTILDDNIRASHSEHRTSKVLIQQAFTILLFFGIGISGFLYLTRDLVTRIISTPSFVTTMIHGYSSIDAMAIVVWIFLFYFISSLATYILIAHGRQRSMMIVNAGIAFFNVVGNILVIPHYSFIGSAIVTLISQIFLVIATWYLVRWDLIIRDILTKNLRILILWLIAWLGGYTMWMLFPPLGTMNMVESIEWLILIGWTFGIIYLGGFFVMRKVMK